MGMSKWVLGGLGLVLCTGGMLSAESSSSGQTISERIAVQQARLVEIEEVASRERAKFEREHDQRLEELTRDLPYAAAAGMDYSYRIRWVEFAKMHQGLPYAQGYFEWPSHVVPAGRYDRPAHLRQAMEQEYFIAEMARLLVSEEFRQKLTQVADERWDTPRLSLLWEEAKELLALVTRVQREVAMELRQLEDQRTERRETAVEWERNLKAQVRDILDYLRDSESRENRPGVVESIGRSPRSGYFCMIEGVDQVLEAGDTIGEIRILGIDSEKVTFAKDGVTWTQFLGAPAPTHWQ